MENNPLLFPSNYSLQAFTIEGAQVIEENGYHVIQRQQCGCWRRTDAAYLFSVSTRYASERNRTGKALALGFLFVSC
jgi:hypothetical protein